MSIKKWVNKGGELRHNSPPYTRRGLRRNVGGGGFSMTR